MVDGIAEVRELVNGGLTANERGVSGIRETQAIVISRGVEPETRRRAISVNLGCHKCVADRVKGKVSDGPTFTRR